MKSQRIRVRNIPVIDRNEYEVTIHVKPNGTLIFLMAAGAVMLFLKPYLMITGITMIALGLFCLFVMPDRNLIQFRKEYLILYNRHDREECTLIYYDEIVSWQYEWHKNYDQVVFLLVDGSTEIQETYSLRSVRKLLDQHAPGKMKKSAWIRKEA